MNAVKDEKMAEIYRSAVASIEDILATMQDKTVDRLNDDNDDLMQRAEAAEARVAQLQAERDALAAQLATVTAERDELKRKYDRACNYDFLNEALNSGDGVYRP